MRLNSWGQQRAMIQYQLKLKLTPRQERQLDHWLWHLGSVWNWAVRKIEQDAYDNIFYSSLTFRNILNAHGPKIGVPQDAINGTLKTAHTAWQRRFKNLACKPRLKGRKNKLNSIAFAHGTRIERGRLLVPGLKWTCFHKQHVPEGHIGQFRIIRRASGWYACLFIQAESIKIPRVASKVVGIDPGFNSLLVLSNGEKIDHPRELETAALRLAQAQRGKARKLTARIQERISNQRKDRNHKLSRRLVSENVFIAFSKDHIKGIARKFGKSVASSGHYQLRQMLAYKSPTSGTHYVEVDSRNSTRTCSTCGALAGPTGWAGLSVREWDCSVCGTHHDRDINAAVNTLIAGAGLAHETLVRVA